MSLDPRLRAMIGPDAVGAIIDGAVHRRGRRERHDAGARRARARSRSRRAALAAGTRLRVQLLARDVIVSTRMPQFLSVRNSLRGVVDDAIDDDGMAPI